MAKRYPIGTRIKFLYKHIDANKTGVIVGLQGNGNPIIFLPKADKHIMRNYYPTLPDGTKFSWNCKWHEIEPLVVKGQQLLFSFMEE